MSSATSGDDDAVTEPLPLLAALPGLNSFSAAAANPPATASMGAVFNPEPHPASPEPDSQNLFDPRYEPASPNRAVDPFTPSRRRRGRRDVRGGKIASSGAGLAALVLAGGLVLHVATSPDQQDSVNSAPSQTETAPHPADQQRLTTLLPPAFSAALTCQAGQTNPPGTAASVQCTPRGQHLEAPAGATYRLAAQKDNLDALLKAALDHTTIQLCPGNIQSPGPWHRTAHPNVFAGTVYCGARGSTAVVGWTDTDKLTIAEIRSSPMPSDTRTGSAMVALYQWWSMNSCCRN